MVPQDKQLRIPPASLVDTRGGPIEHEEGIALSVRFPVLPLYADPLGDMQGGYIVAALDNTLGLLSYLIAPLSVTSAMNTQYLRLVKPGGVVPGGCQILSEQSRSGVRRPGCNAFEQTAIRQQRAEQGQFETDLESVSPVFDPFISGGLRKQHQ